MQLLYDINRSLKANPPSYPSDKGIKFIERKDGVLSKLKIMTPTGVLLQPREKSLEEGQYGLEHSYRVNGVLYDKEVMVVELRADGEEELISGYGRNATFAKIGAKRYFYDLVEFESPYWKEVWKRRFNTSKDHVAKGTLNTEGTYLKGLISLKNQKGFNFRDDDEVRMALLEMSDGQLHEDQIEKLLTKFRKSNSREEGVTALTQAEANAAARLLNLPTGGYVKDSSLVSWDSTGFVRYEGNFSGKIYDFVNLYDNYGEKIQITGFIQNVVHDNIAQQRKDYLNGYNKTVKWMKKFLHKDYHDIVEFKGFLAQINTADPSQGGLPRERGLVDKTGKIL